MPRFTNKIIRYSIAALLCCAIEGRTQSVDIFAGGGYGGYRHKELRDYQQYLVQNAAVAASITDAFPPFYSYLFGLNIHRNKWLFGVEGGHGSCGGRVYYEDYSGKLVADQLVTFNYSGFAPAMVIYKTKTVALTAGVKVLMVWHKLAIRNSLTIGTSILREEEDFTGINIGVQPYVAVRKYIGSFFVQGSAGYELQNKGVPQTKDDPRLFLNNGHGDPVHLQGNGFRITLCAGFRR